MFDSIWQDIRFGLVQMRRRPRLSATIVLCLTLGIGPNITLFSLINAVLFRPLEVYQPERLVRIGERSQDDPEFLDTVAFPYYEDILRENHAFEGVLASSVFEASARLGSESEMIIVEAATSNYFALLGREAGLGRVFAPQGEELPGRQPYVVLSHRFWQEKFAADPQVLGRTLLLNGFDFEIIGVMPATFNGTSSIFQPQVWVPVMMIGQIVPAETNKLSSRTSSWIWLVGRLKDGIDLDQANQDLEAVTQALTLRDPDTHAHKRYGAQGLTQLGLPVPKTVQMVSASMAQGIVGLILLVACSSVAALLLARSTERHLEIATRLALGAKRSRIVRQLLVESCLLSLLASFLAMLMSLWIFEYLTESIAEIIPIPMQIAINLELAAAELGFVFLLALVTTVLFGLAPALQVSRIDLFTILKDQPALGGTNGQTSRLRNLFLLCQFSVSVLLLVIAGLALKSLRYTTDMDPGYHRDNILLFGTDMSFYGYSADEQARFADGLVEELLQLEAVEAVAITRTPPMGLGRSASYIGPFYENLESGERIRVQYSLVGEDFFSTLGISVFKGREFNGEDRRYINPVAVVNQALADTFFAGEDPIGKYLSFEQGDAHEIVGLVANVANENLGQMDQPYLYVPLGHRFSHKLVFVIRTSQAPDKALTAIKALIRQADPDIALDNFRTMDEAIAFFMLRVRVLAILCGALGLLALVLAVIGIYGVVSYSVSLRLQEVGVRLSLGAKPLGLVWLLVRGGMGLVLLGCGIGLGIAFAATSSMGDLFQGVDPTDPLVFASTPLLLGAVAFAALVLPAGRAVRTDPMKVLRYE